MPNTKRYFDSVQREAAQNAEEDFNKRTRWQRLLLPSAFAPSYEGSEEQKGLYETEQLIERMRATDLGMIPSQEDQTPTPLGPPDESGDYADTSEEQLGNEDTGDADIIDDDFDDDKMDEIDERYNDYDDFDDDEGGESDDDEDTDYFADQPENAHEPDSLLMDDDTEISADDISGAAMRNGSDWEDAEQYT